MRNVYFVRKWANDSFQISTINKSCIAALKNILFAIPRSIEKDTNEEYSKLESLLSNHEVVVDKEIQNNISQAFADKKDDTLNLCFDEKYIVVKDSNWRIIQGKRARLDNTSPTHQN